MDGSAFFFAFLGALVVALAGFACWRFGRRGLSQETLQLRTSFRELSIERADRRQQMTLAKNLIEDLVRDSGSGDLARRLEFIIGVLTERRRAENTTEKIAKLNARI